MTISNIIHCEKGWKKLYIPIVEMVFKHDDKHQDPTKKIGIKEIKEVDGALVIEVVNENNLTSEIRDEILIREHNSLNVCEFCGTENNIGTTMNNDYKTCCKECWEDIILVTNPNSIWKEYSTNKFYQKTQDNGK